MSDTFPTLDALQLAHPHLEGVIDHARQTARSAVRTVADVGFDDPVIVWWGSSLPDTSTRKRFHRRSTCDQLKARNVVSSRLRTTEVAQRTCYACSSPQTAGEHAGDRARTWLHIVERVEALVESAGRDITLGEILTQENDLDRLVESSNKLDDDALTSDVQQAAAAVCSALQALRELATASQEARHSTTVRNPEGPFATVQQIAPHDVAVALALDLVGTRDTNTQWARSTSRPPARAAADSVLGLGTAHPGWVTAVWDQLVKAILAGTPVDDTRAHIWPAEWLAEGPTTFDQLPSEIPSPPPGQAITRDWLASVWATEATRRLETLIDGWLDRLKELRDAWAGQGTLTVDLKTVREVGRLVHAERTVDHLIRTASAPTVRDGRLVLEVSAAAARWLDHHSKEPVTFGPAGRNDAEVVSAALALRSPELPLDQALAAAQAIMAVAA